ncbi:MAG: hypothetical protein V2G42_02100 [bacterium JZ-2024 1]
MCKPFPDLILKELEGFHIEEMILIDPPALEPALTLREVGYRIYSVHTDPLYYRMFRSFIGGNYRKIRESVLMDHLRDVIRATSHARLKDVIHQTLRVAWEGLSPPEQGVALWVADRLLLWAHEQNKASPSLSPPIPELVHELILQAESFLKDTRAPHLSLIADSRTDFSLVPADAAIAFAGDGETMKYVRQALEESGLTRFRNRLGYEVLSKYYALVPVWIVIGLADPQQLKAIVTWVRKRRKRVRCTSLYQEDDGRSHLLVVGWD